MEANNNRESSKGWNSYESNLNSPYTSLGSTSKRAFSAVSGGILYLYYLLSLY